MAIKFTRPFQVSAIIDVSDEEKAFSDLTPEERDKCRRFWSKFRLLERVQIASLLIPTLLLWAFPNIEAPVPRAVGLAFIAAFLITHVWLYNLDCPRCGAKFSGGLIALLPRVRYPWDCYGCDLSRRELNYIANRVA